MNKFEKKLINAGFHKLQEKEDMIYYDKTIDCQDSSFQQICLVYDRLNKKVQSVNSFILNECNMDMVCVDYSQHELNQLLSS